MLISPPSSEKELLERAFALAGKTLGDLSREWNQTLPDSLVYAKGWIGQLLEKALGAQAGSLDQPDFIDLGIELKTLPITENGHPCESTFLCSVTLPNHERDFYQSRAWHKLARILWIPVLMLPDRSIPQRRIGTPLLWSPSEHLAATLQQDWEEIIELITLGHFDQLDAHKGQYLQIRPKAANSKTLIKVVNHTGETISIVPKGFYLRVELTKTIIHENYIII
ncbi:DNA mismatch repair endonuclease MutH [Candidatus Berkiella aquae]|uniref:DNA mismatch repair protein MutH n=1 Tax=Candidatus Berkiella aquae TaxID=295108 RepID=A0A0Q9YXM0_9GAMM|nr:DNA mismatch repair endonuclease MutH [Candidatus Berkiella aquae]MCS5712517.1 DNA mismatch repair endonuclease MutH [Candidatus Berkiella aquae]